ncbi:MAG: (d)CMP kinase [Thermodesulfobacteriota bacterium]|nr:MAG: (d)CMP kinase [Thermodesulfobacteriota bacterium]
MGTKGKKGPVIAIDGPSGVGKTTVSRLIAKRLGFRYVDTGAMYRAMALSADASGIDPGDDEALEKFCSAAKIEYDCTSGSISINKVDYTGSIRTRNAAQLASVFSRKRPVRKSLVQYQRALGRGGFIVMEGRDIGTVVFPDADIKFYLDAEPSVRAARRHDDDASNEKSGVETVAKEIEERDRRDRSRRESPLKKAEDAVYIDTTGLDLNDVVQRLMKLIRERLDLGDEDGDGYGDTDS